MTYYADDSITLHHGHALSDSNPIEVLGRKVERLAQTDRFDGNLHPPDHVLARARSAERGVSERVGLRSGKVLGRPEKQAVFRLRSLYSQEGEHGEQCFGRDLIGRLPVVERSTASYRRTLKHQRTAERVSQQVRDFLSDLLQAYPLGIGGLTPVAMPCGVRRSTDSDRAIRIHRPSQVRINS